MEWRAVADGTVLDRLTGDGRNDHVRRNGPVRTLTNAAFHPENSRNGLMFHAGGSGSSSDSDHHVGDLNQSNSSPQGAAANTYDETQRSHQQGEYVSSTSNGHLEGPVDCFSLDFGVVNAAKSSAETLEQRLHDVIRQREQLQRVEAELRAQFIARSEVLHLQNKFEEQIKQQASIIANLQEQLEDRDQRIHNLEQQLDEQEQQLQENQREANEAVWAKDGLLREQTNELTNLRLEYAEQKTAVAQFEVDRAQYLSQLQDLEEQIREKDLQLQEIDEQRRNTQEASMYKDKQLRDAQAWIQRAQELDAFHASANSSLQAELRDRTDQVNQLWIGHQRQLADVERFHCQTIQRLQLEVAEVREQNRMLKGGADKNDNKNEPATHPAGKDVALGVVTDQVDRMTGRLPSGLPALNDQVGHATGLPIPPSQVLGNTATILHVNPLPVLHQFTGQAQGVGASVTATSQFTQPGPAQFANPVILPAPQQLSVMHQQGNQADPNLVLQQPKPSQPQHFSHPHQLHIYSRFPDAKSVMSVQSGSVKPVQLQQETNQEVMLDVSVSQQNNDAEFSHAAYPEPVTHGSILGSFHKLQVGIHAEPNKKLDQQDGKQVLVQRNLKDKHETYREKLPEHGSMLSAAQVAGAPEFHDPNQGLKTDDVNSLSIAQQVHPSQVQQPAVSDVLTQLSPEQKSGLNSEGQHMSSPHTTEFQLTMSFERNKQDASDTKILQREMPSMQPWQASDVNPKHVEPTLLDEKSLLACLVRAIPSEASGPIKISTTLPNRLGKMLAPLHWHDYKKQYGRLDDFVSMHPELFVINGDFIHLREGAHAIISATTTVAKVAAAAAGTPAMGVMWPSTVAVTPVAQSQAQKLQKTMTLGQNIKNLRSVTTHSHNLEAPEGVLVQLHINPSGSLHQDDIRKRGVAENLASHIGGGQRAMMLESRPDELSLVAKSPFGLSNGLELNEVNSTGFGASGRRNNMLY